MSDYDNTFWYLVGQNSNDPGGPSGGGRGPGCFVWSLILFVCVFLPLWFLVSLNLSDGMLIVVVATAAYLLWRYATKDQKKREEQKKQEQARLEQQKLDWEKQKQEKLDLEKQEKEQKEQQEDPELM